MDDPGTPLDWIATGATLAGAYAVLATYAVLQRVAHLAGPLAHERSMASMARSVMRLARLTCGTRFRCEGRHYAVPRRGYIVVANHQSPFDLAMIAGFLAPLAPRFAGRPNLFGRLPGLTYALKVGGSAWIDPEDPRQAGQELNRLGVLVREDRASVAVFPERLPSTDGTMRPFQTAGLRALCARAPAAPVLPVTCSGGARLLARHGRPLVRGVVMVLKVHPPVPAPDTADARAFGAFVRQIERTIRRALPVTEAPPEAIEIETTRTV